MSIMPSDRNKRHEELLRKIAMPKSGLPDPRLDAAGSETDRSSEPPDGIVQSSKAGDSPLRKRKPGK